MKVCREREGRVEGNEGRRVGEEWGKRKEEERILNKRNLRARREGKKWRKEREGGKVR